MTWLAWRQQRTEALLTAGLLLLLCIIFIPAGLSLADAFHVDGIGTCAAVPNEACATAVQSFEDRFDSLLGITDYFSLIPVLIAMMFAGPFVAELDRGTFRIALTQSITRTRWVTTKLLFVGVGSLTTAVAMTALFSWWRRPWDTLEGRIEPTAFQLVGVAPVAYTVFAAAVVLAIGVVLRRTVATIGIATLAFLVVRIVIETWVRPHFRAPLVSATGVDGVPDSAWRLGIAPDHAGVFFQPNDRFWQFQWIEAGLYVALTALLTAFIGWRLRDRLS